jgi:hypothetical protein
MNSRMQKAELPSFVHRDEARCDPLCPCLHRPYHIQTHQIVYANCTRFNEVVTYDVTVLGYCRCPPCVKESPIKIPLEDR